MSGLEVRTLYSNNLNINQTNNINNIQNEFKLIIINSTLQPECQPKQE